MAKERKEAKGLCTDFTVGVTAVPGPAAGDRLTVQIKARSGASITDWQVHGPVGNEGLTVVDDMTARFVGTAGSYEAVATTAAGACGRVEFTLPLA